MNRPSIVSAVSTVLIAFGIGNPAAAEDVAAPPPPGFSLTIYSTADPAIFDPLEYTRQKALGYVPPLPGYGVVREVRKIDLAAGQNTIKFTDVASGIDPTTVAFKSLTAPNSTTVLEQSYEYDLVNPEKLLEKYIGHAVIINRKQTPLHEDKTHQPETIEGKLLSFDANTFVLQTENKRLPLQLIPRGSDVSEIKLFDLQTGLITKPTLVWKLAADQTGKHDAQVTYQSEGLTWRADYNFVVNGDDTKVDVGSWVSIMNESGASYPDAKLKLIAGDVHRLPRPTDNQRQGGLFGGGGAGGAGVPQFSEKSLFEYHLYTLSHPTSLPNSSVKQIELFPLRSSVAATKTYVYYGLPENIRYWIAPDPVLDGSLGNTSNPKVDIYLKVMNSEKNGLGLPLPAGRVRVYKRDDADAATEFIGEDVIPHTPKDEEVLIRLGTAFDIVGERKQTEFHAEHNERFITENFEITLRNHKKEAVNVIIRENLYRWFNWEITQSSDKYQKQDFRTIHFPVNVPAGGEKKVTYQVKYSW